MKTSTALSRSINTFQLLRVCKEKEAAFRCLPRTFENAPIRETEFTFRPVGFNDGNMYGAD